MKWQYFLETERTEAVAGVERREGEKERNGLERRSGRMR
jgi:hypothetical protein